MLPAKKGITGISTLILFIALIIVTAIAANVLMQSTESLKSQASQTSKESKEQITTKINVLDVAGETSDANDSITFLRITVKLPKGSATLPLSTTHMSVQTDLNYITGIDYNKSSGNSEAEMRGSLNSFNVFSVRYLGAVASNRDYLEPNELSEIWYDLNGILGKDADLKVVLRPEIGQETTINLRTPSVFNKEIIDLYS